MGILTSIGIVRLRAVGYPAIQCFSRRFAHDYSGGRNHL